MHNEKTYTILVVEDNPGDFFLLKEYLRSTKLVIEEIVRAEKLSDIDESVQNKNFDLVFLDLTLPDSEGINSVITLNTLMPKVPIIVLSGIDEAEIATHALSVGAQDYLMKNDFNLKILQKTIHYSIERKKILENLRESYNRYQLVEKATNDVIWEWNIYSDDFSWSRSVENMFGYSKEEVQHDIKWKFANIHEEDRERVIAKIKESVDKRINLWQDEYRFRCRNGYYKTVFDRGYLVEDERRGSFRFTGAMQDITERRLLEKSLAEQKVQRQKEITEATLLAQEKEREDIGRELHDNINQLLSSSRIHLSIALKEKDSNKERAERMMQSTYENIGDAIEEIRKLSKSLVSPSLNTGTLEESIRDLINIYNTTKINIRLVFSDCDEDSIDDKFKLTLYRIVQEQLNNIVRHSQAANALISLTCIEGMVEMIIKDDGVGFDASVKPRGIGLANIYNRAELYSGKVQILTSPGNGCILTIQIPLPQKEVF